MQSKVGLVHWDQVILIGRRARAELDAAIATALPEELADLPEVCCATVWNAFALLVIGAPHLLKKDSDGRVRDVWAPPWHGRRIRVETPADPFAYAFNPPPRSRPTAKP